MSLHATDTLIECLPARTGPAGGRTADGMLEVDELSSRSPSNKLGRGWPRVDETVSTDYRVWYECVCHGNDDNILRTICVGGATVAGVADAIEEAEESGLSGARPPAAGGTCTTNGEIPCERAIEPAVEGVLARGYGVQMLAHKRRRDRYMGSGGMWADASLEGVSGRFDASVDPPSNPTKRSSNYQLEVMAS